MIVELFIIAIGFSADAFAVSIGKGLSVGKARTRDCLITGLYFGGFQAIMPLIGFYLGSLFAELVQAVDHWVAFILLALIGANMIRESFSKDDDDEHNSSFGVKTMFPLAIATSIDALAGGVAFAMEGDVNIWLAITLIGITTFILSSVGVKVGGMLGEKFKSKAELIGGIILIIMGLKILLGDLGVLPF